MKSFNAERVSTLKLNIPYEIELVTINPIKKANSMCLFIGGLNNDKSSIKYLNNPLFDDKYLYCFNHRQWDDNTQKSSKKPNIYLDDVYNVVQELKKLHKDLRVYLLGESFGAGLAIMYAKKYPTSYDHVFAWNMPYGISKTGDETKKQQLSTGFKMLLTFFFNASTKSLAFFPEKLTNNKILLRAIKVNNQGKESDNRVVVAAWVALRKGWWLLLQNLASNDFKVTYIQGENDALKSKKMINKLNKKYPLLINKKYYLLEKGTHILAFDVEADKMLFEIIEKTINQHK